MSAPGRNDPCPCGSARKFKYCCLTKGQPATGITRADRTEAIDALHRVARREEFVEVVATALVMWAGNRDDDPEAAIGEMLSFDTARNAFFEWLFFDLPLDDMRPMSAWFLEKESAPVGRPSPCAILTG